MKINLKQSTFLSKRFLGFESKLSIKADLDTRLMYIHKEIFNSGDGHLVGSRIYLSLIDPEKIEGPFVEILGKTPGNSLINVLDYRNQKVFTMALDPAIYPISSLFADLSGVFELIDIVKRKILAKKVFLTLDLNKIELLFFE